MTPAAETLAFEFSENLRSYLTEEQMAEVVRLNHSETATGICHSHDFCDSNMFLYDVFIKYGIDPVEEGGVYRWSNLWNRVWNMAKASEFRIN